jgi:hypothetical protein
MCGRGREREVNETGMGGGAESMDMDIVISMIYMMRLVLGVYRITTKPSSCGKEL